MEKKKQFLMKQKEHLNRGKRGILSVIFGRTGILLILILLQIGLLLVGFRFLSNSVFAIYGGAMVLGFLLSVYLINQKGNPAFKIAWVIIQYSDILKYITGSISGGSVRKRDRKKWETSNTEDRIIQKRCLNDAGRR